MSTALATILVDLAIAVVVVHGGTVFSDSWIDAGIEVVAVRTEVAAQTVSIAVAIGAIG